MPRMSTTEYREFKAAQRAEWIGALLAPFVERRAQLELRQAHIEAALERLRASQLESGGSTSIDAQIAELESEWRLSRQVEAHLNEEEGVAKKAVARLR